MLKIERGDELQHDDYGTIIFDSIIETLDTTNFTLKNEEVVFEGGNVDSVLVRFKIKGDEHMKTESLQEFQTNVPLRSLKSD